MSIRYRLHSFTIIYMALLFTGQAMLLAQSEQGKRKILQYYQSKNLGELSERLHIKWMVDRNNGLVAAGKRNLPLKKKLLDGGVSELVKMGKHGSPIYFRTFNSEASRTTRTNYLQNGSPLGLNLNGEQMVIGIWDSGHPRVSHLEFQNFTDHIVIGDAKEPETDLHASHVTGTITASGLNEMAKGMSPFAQSIAFDWENDIAEAAVQAAKGLLLSNHSYGWDSQWLSEDGYSFLFGAYNDEAREWDELMFEAPYYLMVVAAGNDGEKNYNEVPMDPVYPEYDKLSGMATAKNNLVIGAANPAEIDSNGDLVGDVVMAVFSSQGPTDDLRIKPDVTGQGVGVLSTGYSSDQEYLILSGTSMSSPNVSGTLLLLQQYEELKKGKLLKAATLKGVVLHSADNVGSLGPDAHSGWGLLNAKAAVSLLQEDGRTTRVLENQLVDGQTNTFVVASNGEEPLRVSISWTDPPGQPNYALNDPSPVLVHDLDLKVSNKITDFYPWRLTAVNQNAQDGRNTVDPFERVDILDAEGMYSITVSHLGILEGNQEYTLIISGLAPLPILGEVLPTEVTENSIQVSSSIVWEGFGGIQDKGFRWSETERTGSNSEDQISLGQGSGDFSSKISGLKPNTTYTIVAYAENDEGTVNSSLATFTTLATVPSVSEVQVSDINSSGADLSSVIVSDGGLPLTSAGFVYGEVAGFAHSEGIRVSVSGSTLETILEDLHPNRTYYVRSYAENELGLSEGAEASFTTMGALATVSAPDTLDVAVGSARVAFRLVEDWQMGVDEIGLLFGKSEPITVENGIFFKSSELLSFHTFDLEGLQPMSTYYVRAMVKNSKGIGYSRVTSFTTDQDTIAPDLIELKFEDEVDFEISGGHPVQFSAFDAFGLKDVRVRYKGIRKNPLSEDWEESENLLLATVDSLSMTYELPKSSFDELGLMHYLRLEDVSGNVFKSGIGYSYNRYTTEFPYVYPLSHVGPRVSDYRMFGSPLISDQPITEPFITALGKMDPSLWRIFDLDQGDVVEVSDGAFSQPGTGYWLIGAAPASIPFQGHVAKVRHDRPFLLQLRKGWNLLANPYPFSIFWQEIMEVNHPVNSLLSDPIVYDGDYKFVNKLPPFQGFYMYAPEDALLEVPISNTQEGIKSTESSLPKNGWQLLMNQGKVPDAAQAVLVLGMDSRPEIVSGNLRIPALPNDPPKPGITIFAEETRNTPLSRHIVTPDSIYSWMIKLNADPSPEKRFLSWRIRGEFPENYGLYLLPDVSKEPIDMRSVTRFDLIKPGMSKLYIEFREEEKTAFDGIGVGAPFPNPTDGRIAIPYHNDTGRQAVGRLILYSSNGRVAMEMEVPLNKGSDQLEIGVNHFQKGLYFVRIVVTDPVISEDIYKIWLK